MRDAFTLTMLVGLCLLAMRLFRLGLAGRADQPGDDDRHQGRRRPDGGRSRSCRPSSGSAATPEDEGFFGKLADTLSKLGDANAATVAVSAAAIAILLVLRRVAPQVPGPLVVVARRHPARRPDRHRGARARPDRRGSVGPADPDAADAGATSAPCCPAPLAIAVMAFMETVLVARAQRQRSEPPIDSDQELLANGAAALVGGLSQCLPPAGGFSQSAVNQRAGRAVPARRGHHGRARGAGRALPRPGPRRPARRRSSPRW